MSFQKIIIEGNLGKDPQVHNFQDGGALATFSLAVTEKGYTTRSGQQVPEHTEWFNVVVKGNTANVVAQYAHKGDKLLVEGKLKTRTYNDSQTQQTRQTTELVADSVVFLSTKSDNNQSQGYNQGNAPQYNPNGGQGGYNQPQGGYNPNGGYNPQPQGGFNPQPQGNAPQGNGNFPF